MKFTVERAKWLRGTCDGMLLTKSGLRCCLGFCATQLGAEDAALLGVGLPGCVSGIDLPHLTIRDPRGFRVDSALTDKAISINDDKLMTDEDREARLIALFAEHGHEIEFK